MIAGSPNPARRARLAHAFDNVTPAGVRAIARDSLLAEAGLDLAIGRNATLGISYVGQRPQCPALNAPALGKIERLSFVIG
jgi:hypothetical protein